MPKPTLLVTGASGHLGRRALELLLARGERVIAGTRDPSKLADLAARVEIRRVDFDDVASLDAAFAGVARVLLVSSDALDRPGHRAEQHLRAVAALVKAGVKHVVYTSLTNAVAGSAISLADDHRQTEEAIVASGLGYTILRNNVYAESLLQAVPQAIASGRFVTARGDGAIGYVTRDDCARAAAAALASAFDGRRLLDVTGPATLTGSDVARLASRIGGKPVANLDLPAAAWRDGMVAAGLPGFVADLLLSFEVAAARGELAVVSRAVEDLTGTPATPVGEFVSASLPAMAA